MGWSTSHDTTHRSADAIQEVGQQVAHVATGKDWRTVQPLFQLANRADGPFTIPAREAGRMAAVLEKAAGHSLMPIAWRTEVASLADAAQRAATARQPWEWS
ncbi:DUF7739 domain-containing protein [Streptomyces malaysiensis]|uniref:DUF7739 domain-containing protein n=1 Tax=Streptomyces malaysiensis subsp. samsunensis TaxID=459658 RepID=A0A9X2RUZ7_STRMQ|nr:hypothetical protein [Streptomyces samsunensis]MCQ8831777.1 hypothetical protein [Streptomyces samsunensis]